MFAKVCKKISGALKSLDKAPALRSFVQHNQSMFPQPSSAQGGPVVLFELNAMQSAHIAYSYLANALSVQHEARILGFAQRAHQSLWQKFSFTLKAILGIAEFGTYKSFGAKDFFAPTLSPQQRSKAAAMCQEALSGFRTKWDVEALTLHGVWVGDLVYDSFLMTYKQPTIKLDSPLFKQSLLESIEHFVFWEDYFDAHDVRGVNVSHCVYNLAMPLRIAVQRGIPAFQAGITHLYRVRPDNLFAYNDFHYFPERFRGLPDEVRAAGVAEAKRRIDRRFSGEVGVDMAYSTKSAYGAPRQERLVRESTRTKILIATHCFFDSPHSYGNNLFPDFYEWLTFLGEVSEVTDYDWYIKTHPDYLQGTKEVIDYFVMKYPKLTLVPSDASHHQLIAEGINVALTAYGTIAFEYAALGVPVINASLNNPHIAYGFNIHAQDVEHYGRLLAALDGLEFQIDRQQVYEYYFMRYIYNTEDLFFENYDRAIAELGGYAEQFTPAVYAKWLEEWSPEKHVAILRAVSTFIKSGDFRMDYTHYNREFTVESIGVGA